MNNGVKKIRLKLGMSRSEFARAVGRRTSAISNYELGIRNPDLTTAYAIIDLAKKHAGMKTTLEDIYQRPLPHSNNETLRKP